MDRGDPNPAMYQVGERDLARIIGRVKVTRSAEDLTTLARHFVEDRLASGPVHDATVAQPIAESDRIRLWDPADAWHVGDRALFAVPDARGEVGALPPRVGEVMQLRGKGVVVRLDGEPGTRIYGAAPAFGDTVGVIEWRQSVEDLVRELGDRSDGRAQVAYVLWSHGEEIVSALLSALRHDSRFVSLEGRWFPRSMAILPSGDQLEGLARAMLSGSRLPMTVGALLRWLPPPVASGDSGIFGLALGLHQRPDLFTNVDSEARPRWMLIGPPPGTYTARYAAFDPELFVPLCEPGELLSPEVVQRLWSLDLLNVVVERRTP
ncbi:MAG: hypothetical protein JXC32_22520 [Anaerolineae bacterium]|nr:hypothetical protein [Anaerolineae bacterium]